jgi:hypothetical protein
VDAQRRGRVLLAEQIDAVEALIAQRCSTARASAAAGFADDWDWAAWGRTTYVFESLLSFLQRLASDPEARDYFSGKLRRAGKK